LWFTLAVLLAGLLIAGTLAALVLSLIGRIYLPVQLSEANYFLLLMFLGMLGFGDLYLLYSAFIAFERDRYDNW
jgi:hypothetical protein